MTAMLEVRGLTKHFYMRRGILRRIAGTVQAANDINFDVNEGETLAIVGESGCGKSTIGRTLLGLTPATAGTVSLDGEQVLTLDKTAMRSMRRKMQIIFQDPYGSLNPRMTVAETLAEPLLLHDLATPADVSQKVAELLDICGLQPWHAGRYPHEFSGGQRQRVGIARALATRPRVIVCDEPVSALDVSVQAQIINLLEDLQRQFGIGYVFISHDLAVVRHVATRVAVVYLGRIVEEAPTAALYAQPRHPYTLSLIKAAPRPDPSVEQISAPVQGDLPSALNPPSGCAFHPRCPMAQDRCRKERPELRPLDGGKVACHFAEQIQEGGFGEPTPVPPMLQRRLDVLERARAQSGAE
ncbi:peptide ABC transporter substrate-binding protein [Pelagivirga sediminicola]|uniref:Peptide ABC transporter substrate-binding protein n=1 Tax=Pelagivirga sediminicola TaxID=2170575 RepID=A0A2T7G3F5_9RHOB|nr:dipeptide ABC transporter ATP-binding protein [Pelagivirga sediminicola]PVA08928.1 peptide ABC transporter substrate-binding protein [Pelagivirga sediminicola]